MTHHSQIYCIFIEKISSKRISSLVAKRNSFKRDVDQICDLSRYFQRLRFLQSAIFVDSLDCLTPSGESIPAKQCGSHCLYCINQSLLSFQFFFFFAFFYVRVILCVYVCVRSHTIIFYTHLLFSFLCCVFAFLKATHFFSSRCDICLNEMASMILFYYLFLFFNLKTQLSSIFLSIFFSSIFLFLPPRFHLVLFRTYRKNWHLLTKTH